MKILVTSAKGGVGKTTLSILLAEILSSKYKDKDFYLLDLDLPLGNIRVYYEIKENIISQELNFNKVIKVKDNFFVFYPLDIEFTNDDIINFLRNNFNDNNKICIVDSSAKIGQIRKIINEFDKIILIVTSEVTAILNCYQFIKRFLNILKNKDLIVIFNKISFEKEGIYRVERFQKLIEKYLNFKIKGLFLLEDKEINNLFVNGDFTKISHKNKKLLKKLIDELKI